MDTHFWTWANAGILAAAIIVAGVQLGFEPVTRGQARGARQWESDALGNVIPEWG